jgi:dipeptidyl aminopeptidase
MGENTRFLIMHGVADDNVHYQNTLTLLDKLNLQNIDNWDMVMYPDSDHSIYFHNAHTVVYERKFEPILLDAMAFGLTFPTRLVELAHQCFQWRVAPHCQSEACGVILEAGQALCRQQTILHILSLTYPSPLLLGGVISG